MNCKTWSRTAETWVSKKPCTKDVRSLVRQRNRELKHILPNSDTKDDKSIPETTVSETMTVETTAAPEATALGTTTSEAMGQKLQIQKL